MIIYLIRHGETDWNKAFRFQGQSDIPLNASGIALAKKTAEALRTVPFEMAFSSPLCRALETARIIIGDRQIPLSTDDRLKEISFGVWEGTVVPPQMKEGDSNPLYDFWKRPKQYVPGQNGESFHSLYQRSASFLKEKILPLEGVCETVLLAGHGALNRSILNTIAQIPLEDFWHFSLKNCAVSQISLKNGHFHILEPGRTYD